MTHCEQEKRGSISMDIPKATKYLIMFCLFCVCQTVSAQINQDTLLPQADKIDTVRVKKKIVINKVVYLPELPKTNRLFLSAYGAMYGEKSYYKVCDVCKSYFDQVQSATSPAVSYTYGFDMAYAPKKIYYSLGASNTFYRSNFNFTDNSKREYTAVNMLTYTSVNLHVGYWFRKDKKGFSYLLLGGSSYQFLTSIEGLTLKKDNSDQVNYLQNEIEYYPTNTTLNLLGRLFYNVYSKAYVYSDIFYNYDIRSILKTAQIVQQRNMLGINAGILYRIK